VYIYIYQGSEGLDVIGVNTTRATNKTKKLNSVT
jgi:hypothetical protein